MLEETSVNLNERKENDNDSNYCIRVCFLLFSFFFFLVSGQIFLVAILLCLNA